MSSPRLQYFYFIVIAIGVILRLVWTSDMEWKSDEQWMYKKAHEVAATGEIPPVGMPSGGGIVNPGMSVGVFAAIAEFTDDPISMDRVVQVVNVIALLGFLLFALKKVDLSERDIWLAGIALAAINPLAVIYSRKIWAQDVLPIFSFLLILGNANRNKHYGAFLWGCIGALIGQIHMSGFFFAGGIFIYTIFYDRYHHKPIRWLAWLAGTIVGGFPLIWWVQYILTNHQQSFQSWTHIFEFGFYLHWLLDSHGLDIAAASARKEIVDFIKEPVIGGIATYLIALAHAILLGALLLTGRYLYMYIRRVLPLLKKDHITKYLFGSTSLLRFYLFSILIGLGVLLTLSGTVIPPHYIICAIPFQYIFLAKIFHEKRRVFLAIILTQLFITVTFLSYVHIHGGMQRGDYGKTYQSQSEIRP
jgi:hypothetical protein